MRSKSPNKQIIYSMVERGRVGMKCKGVNTDQSRWTLGAGMRPINPNTRAYKPEAIPEHQHQHQFSFEAH